MHAYANYIYIITLVNLNVHRLCKPTTTNTEVSTERTRAKNAPSRSQQHRAVAADAVSDGRPAAVLLEKKQHSHDGSMVLEYMLTFGVHILML